MKRVFSVFFVLVLALCLMAPAWAEDSSVVYEGHNLFGFAPGSEFTATDLFENFKGVLPGDVLTETVTVKNTASCCDFIKVYMRAEPHNEESNPLSDTVAAYESLASMEDFLAQLHMTVWNGDEKIYEGAPCEADGLENNVLLGSFRRNQGTTLTVELTVPIELGNEYAHRVGEVDWVFVVEEFDDANPTVPKTGDEAPLMLYAALLVIALLAIAALLLAAKRRKSSRAEK